MTRRGRAPPAPDDSWARCAESVACHESDAFPRILLLLPTAIALVIGFVFSLSPTLTAAPGVKPAFAATAFSFAALCVCYALAGLPFYRRQGCARGCAVLALAPAARLLALARAARPRAAEPPPPRASEPEFGLPLHAPLAAAAVAEGPVAGAGGAKE